MEIRQPLRVLILGNPTTAYFEASPEEKRDNFLPRFREVLAEWERLGAHVVGSIADDVLVVGPHRAGRSAWYLLYDVPNLNVVASMIEAVRAEDADGVRLDTYITCEARIGRPFYAREE
jgi:hypothetical protein